MSTYEELYAWLIAHVKTRRNKILHTKGKYSSHEKELNNLLSSLATATGGDFAALEEATDKNLYYKPGDVIGF